MKPLYFLFLLSLFHAESIHGQNESADREELTEENTSTAFGRENMLNDGYVQDALVAGGAYYVSNPPPTYEIDVDLVYHEANFQTTTVELMDGSFFETEARYRVLDQKFEVMVEGETYEVDNSRLRQIQIGESLFILLPNLLERRGERVIYQLHFQGDQRGILEEHKANWEDPPTQNMFDTREQHRTIRRSSVAIFRYGQEYFELKSNRDLPKILELPRRGSETDFVKDENLKLQQAKDAARFLSYLEGR